MAGTPIIRSPMKPARKGEVPTIDWAQWVERTLRRLIDVPPPRQRPITGGSSDKPPFWTTISQVPESDPPTYQVAVTLGYLTYQQATLVEEDDGVVGWIAPMIEGESGLVSLEPPSATAEPSVPPWEAPKLELPGVQSYVYLRVKTDKNGAPKLDGESVTIEAFTDEQEDVHHIRASPSGGEEEGDYFFLICQTESNGATPPAPRIVRRITGNRELPNQLIEIENIGGKRELYQGYLVGPDDKHELRTIEQIEGRGEPIIKPLDPGDPEADPPVPAEEEGETIKWKTIAEKESQAQIRVSTKDDGDVVQIEGNSFDQSFGGLVKNLSVNDGLVTGFEDAGGDNFNVEYYTWGVTSDGTTGEVFTTKLSLVFTIYYRDGLASLTDDMEAVTVYEAVADLVGGF